MDRTKKIQVLIEYALIFWLLLSGCSAGPQIATGELQGIYYSTARWIIDGCLSGDCLSYVYLNEAKNLAVYARPLLDNVAFVVTSRSIPLDKVQGGNLVATETWAGFEQWLLDNGFKVISTGTTAFKSLVEAFNLYEYAVPVFFLPVFPDIVEDQGWE